MLRPPWRALGWVGYLTLLVTLFVVSGYFFFSVFVRSGVTAVPDLRGIIESDAEALALDHGLRVERREEPRYDESVPAGDVLLQRPGPGSLVKRGSVVEIVVSLGQELVEVPDLRGRALQAAQVTLNAVGLILGGTASVYGTHERPGTVVAQSPPPGAKVGSSTEVVLFLSLEGRAQTYLMPDLTYLRYEAVGRFFESRGFRLGSVKFESYEGVSPGVVLRQFPLPGHPLRKHDVISLVVTTQELGA
jgi:serine/threonine-protein kinase